MADQSTQSITISAEPADIMAVIADFPCYPEWAKAVRSTEVLAAGADQRAERVRFVIDHGVIKDTYVLSYDWAPDGTAVHWNLVEGQMQKAQRGSYVLAPSGAGTVVTYTLAVDLNIPMIGLFKRKAEKVIMDMALKELKRRVEGT